MNTNPFRLNRLLTAVAAALIMASARAAEPAVTEQIEPAEIALGQSAQLTIAVSGNSTTPIAPPVIPGLDFLEVGQSSQMQSINGRTISTNSVIYQVIPQRVGVYTIPAVTPGSQPLVLRVGAGGSTAAQPSNASGASALPPVSASGLVAGAARMTPDGRAFVRVAVAKHRLYVGESIPVEIQVGVQEGLVASLNGPPSLNGDAFTLNKLSSQPEQVEEIINGKPFTVLTWRSVLAAVKPGALSLTIETPLTVRMQTTGIAPQDLMDDSTLGNFFNDPLFQNFFGGTSEKELTVTSAPVAFNVLALPTQNRPASFSGAVGTFKVRSDLSAATVSAGDPLTLRLHVTGTGDFDRVNSTMLGRLDHWKTYQPTASFAPADSGGYRGEKVFEQPLIATQPGDRTLPGVAFSYFDPDAQRYQTMQTPPLSVAVTPSTSASTIASVIQPASGTGSVPLSTPSHVGLQPDHALTVALVTSLVPPYFQPRFLALPVALTFAFAGSWLWMRRREQDANLHGDAVPAFETQLERMTHAAALGDVPLFLNSARAAVRQALSTRWHVPAEKITVEDIDSRLGADSHDLHELLVLADEATYSGFKHDRTDFQKWTQTVLHAINERAPA